MTEKYIAALRAKVEELRRMLLEARGLRPEKVQAITVEFDRIEQILSEYE